MQNLHIGIDLGTSGCRLIAINDDGDILAEYRLLYDKGIKQTPDLWWDSVKTCLYHLRDLRQSIRNIAIDGTSSTLFLTDKQGHPTTPVLMYYDAKAVEEAVSIRQFAPVNTAAHGASSSLAKYLYLLKHYPDTRHAHIQHQADWIAAKFTGVYGQSDENNVLKLGYDVVNREWSDWLQQRMTHFTHLPTVYQAGEIIATIDINVAKKLNLSPNVCIKAGTTDSIAAFIATGATKQGEAVTSLGSTLVIKMIVKQPIYAPEYGIYSHRLGNQWLVGGASNTGGAVLLHYFSLSDLQQMTPYLKPKQVTGLDYYPLLKTGERFPVSDPNKLPQLSPRPPSDRLFFQGMLEGMAKIETLAYNKLQQLELGSTKLISIRTVGGGHQNTAWTAIRQQQLNVPMIKTQYTEAAYGSALLARGKKE